MTDVEFSNLLSELNKSASELNAGTETVNSVLASVETQLVKMNLGCSPSAQVGQFEAIE